MDEILKLHEECQKYPDYPIIQKLKGDIELCFVKAIRKISVRYFEGAIQAP